MWCVRSFSGKLALLAVLTIGIFILLYCSREHLNPYDSSSSQWKERLPFPRSVRATDGVKKITIQWEMVEDEDLGGYGVYRSEQSNGMYVFLPGDGDSTLGITTGQTTYVDSLFDQSMGKVASKKIHGRGKPAGSGRILKTYYYKVKAVNKDGIQGDFSPYTYASLLVDEFPPGVPSDVVGLADVLDPGVVHVSWRAPEVDADGGSLTGLVGYRVYRSESAGGSYVLVAETDSVGYVDVGLEQVTTYYYILTAYDAAGNESERSSAISVRTSGVEAPTSVTARSSTGRVTVSWSAVSDRDVIGYLVYRSVHPVSGFSPIKRVQAGSQWITTSQTSYEDKDVEWHKTYYYRVTAITLTGFESERSMLVSVWVE